MEVILVGCENRDYLFGRHFCDNLGEPHLTVCPNLEDTCCIKGGGNSLANTRLVGEIEINRGT